MWRCDGGIIIARYAPRRRAGDLWPHRGVPRKRPTFDCHATVRFVPSVLICSAAPTGAYQPARVRARARRRLTGDWPRGQPRETHTSLIDAAGGRKTLETPAEKSTTARSWTPYRVKSAIRAVQPAYLVELLLFALVYYGAGWAGLQMASASKQISVVWPDTGIALAVLVLRGRRLWPAIAIASFVANLASGAPALTSTLISAGDTLEAVIGATALMRVEFQPSLRRLHDVASLFLLAACVSTVIGATVGALALCATGVTPWTGFSSSWSAWWIGDAVSDLVGAPFLFVWVDQARREWRFDRLTEAMLLMIAMLV